MTATSLRAQRMHVTAGLRLVVPTAVTNGAVTMSAALGGVIVARVLGPAGRGTVAAIMAWFVVVQVVGEGGVQGATAFYAARIDTDKRALIGKTARLLVGQALVVAPVSVCIAWALGLPPEFTRGFTLVVVGLIPVLWLSAPLFALQGIRIAVWNKTRMTQPPAYLTALSILWLTGRLSALTAVAAVLASNLVAGTVAAMAARTLVSAVPTGRRRISTKRVYQFALPNLAWSLPTIISGRLDVLSLSVLASASDLGQYAVALSLMSLTVPIVSSIGNVLMPLLSRRSSEGQPLGEIGRTAIACAAAGAFVVTGCLGLAAPWIVPVLFGVSYGDAPRLTWLLAPATVLYATKWVAADVLRGLGEPAVPARAEWMALAVNLVVVPCAAVSFGGAGAALAQSAGFAVALLVILRGLASAPLEHKGRLDEVPGAELQHPFEA